MTSKDIFQFHFQLQKEGHIIELNVEFGEKIFCVALGRDLSLQNCWSVAIHNPGEGIHNPS